MSSLPDWLIAIIGVVFPGLGDPNIIEYNGYVEGDYVYVAPAAVGRIVSIQVAEGEAVSAGQNLFQSDDTHQSAMLRAAQAEVDVARANLENLATGGREAEINVVVASLDQAKADQHLAQATLERSQRLLAAGAVSQARVDGDLASLQSANARVAQLQAQLSVAELPARNAQRIAAEATLEAALARLDDARSALDDRTVEAPVGGRVDMVFYEQGEVALAGAPVVSILPSDSLKALFYIPEADRTQMSLGDIFDVSCSGCPTEVTARLTRLAATPQYTPPIIYSSEERSRLVFRAEAALDNAGGLLPGQPLSLRPRE
ncbi:HlyD family secretion protein [Flavimaricola marinus]|uniref:Multidrug resistance protein MdtN n=1 Tax=Flavimaricola marinus TaxID=1819565 RepID=A0A238LL51_9RHOB|nr:HlyD family efflux transporter periplasmic adaptor subunit [Flavimaricola marinus]SMY10124.1 Multidrug resistance protein MdtN [Flavimaricola marinus]